MSDILSLLLEESIERKKMDQEIKKSISDLDTKNQDEIASLKTQIAESKAQNAEDVAKLKSELSKSDASNKESINEVLKQLDNEKTQRLILEKKLNNLESITSSHINNNNTGKDTTGKDKTGEDTTGEDKTGEDTAGEDKTGEDKTGEDKTGEDETGEDKTGEDETGEENTIENDFLVRAENGKLEIKLGNQTNYSKKVFLSYLKIFTDSKPSDINLNNNFSTYESKNEKENDQIMILIGGKFESIFFGGMNYVEIKKDTWTEIASGFNPSKFEKPNSSFVLGIIEASNNIEARTVKQVEIKNDLVDYRFKAPKQEKDFIIRLKDNKLQIKASSKSNYSDKIWLNSLRLSPLFIIENDNLVDYFDGTHQIKEENGNKLISSKLMNKVSGNVKYLEIKKDDFVDIATNLTPSPINPPQDGESFLQVRIASSVEEANNTNKILNIDADKVEIELVTSSLKSNVKYEEVYSDFFISENVGTSALYNDLLLLSNWFNAPDIHPSPWVVCVYDYMRFTKPMTTVEFELNITPFARWFKNPESEMAVSPFADIRVKYYEIDYNNDWAEIPNDRRDLWEIIGYNEQIWDNDLDVESSWDQFSQEEREAAKKLGFTKEEWDEEEENVSKYELDGSVTSLIAISSLSSSLSSFQVLLKNFSKILEISIDEQLYKEEIENVITFLQFYLNEFDETIGKMYNAWENEGEDFSIAICDFLNSYKYIESGLSNIPDYDENSSELFNFQNNALRSIKLMYEFSKESYSSEGRDEVIESFQNLNFNFDKIRNSGLGKLLFGLEIIQKQKKNILTNDLLVSEKKSDGKITKKSIIEIDEDEDSQDLIGIDKNFKKYINDNEEGIFKNEEEQRDFNIMKYNKKDYVQFNSGEFYPVDYEMDMRPSSFRNTNIYLDPGFYKIKVINKEDSYETNLQIQILTRSVFSSVKTVYLIDRFRNTVFRSEEDIGKFNNGSNYIKILWFRKNVDDKIVSTPYIIIKNNDLYLQGELYITEEGDYFKEDFNDSLSNSGKEFRRNIDLGSDLYLDLVDESISNNPTILETPFSEILKDYINEPEFKAISESKSKTILTDELKEKLKPYEDCLVIFYYDSAYQFYFNGEMGKIIKNNLYDLFNSNQYKNLKVTDVTDKALYIVYTKKENKEISLSSRNHKAYKLYPSDQPILFLYKGLQQNYFINPNIQILSDDEKGKIFDDIVRSDSTKDEWLVVFPNYRSFEVYTVRKKNSSLKSNIIPNSNILAKSAGVQTEISVAELKGVSGTTTFKDMLESRFYIDAEGATNNEIVFKVSSKKYAEECKIDGDVVIISEADRNGNSNTNKEAEDKLEKFKN